MNIYTKNNNMSPFNTTVEHILSLISVGLRINLRHMLAAYQILDYKSFKQLDKKQLLDMTRNVNGIQTKLLLTKVVLLVICIKYIRFHEPNRDYDLTADQKSWDTKKRMGNRKVLLHSHQSRKERLIVGKNAQEET